MRTPVRAIGSAAAIALLAVLTMTISSCGSSSRDPDPGNPDASVDAGIDAPPTPPGAICGGFAGAECKDDQYCDYGDNGCGSTTGSGTCQSRPNNCTGISDPVCGCDGKTHSNACAAYAAGIDINASGSCR